MSSPLQTSFDSPQIMRQLSMSSKTPTRLASGHTPSQDTSLALRELFDETSSPEDSPRQSSFEDTLARISSQHETYKEDSPENDAAFQALFQPIETAQQLKGFVNPSSAQEFVTLHKSLNAMPDRPKTSPSRLALSVVLKPNAEQEQGQRLQNARARLQLLAPIEQEAEPVAPPTNFLTTTEQEEEPRTLGFHLQDIDAQLESDHDQDADTLQDISMDLTGDHSSKSANLETLAARTMAEPSALKMPPSSAAPPMMSPAKLDATPLPASTPRPDTLSSSMTQGTSTLVHDAVTQSHRARKVALAMEQTPNGQKIELEITDSFGKPLLLKISFEHQRARAACYGSNFHDPAQLEYVLDSVRTALAASGYELGDFITHHQRSRDRRHEDDPSGDASASHPEGLEPSPKKKDILHVVGIINRIA